MPVPRTPLLSTDCVIVDARRRVLLIRRGRPPFKGSYALPGGFVERNETVEDACRREVLEETGLRVSRLRLVGVYSAPGRDPRGPATAVAFLARAPRGKPAAGDDAADVEWVEDWRSHPLAFDHRDIIRDAMRLMSATPKR